MRDSLQATWLVLLKIFKDMKTKKDQESPLVRGDQGDMVTKSMGSPRLDPETEKNIND